MNMRMIFGAIIATAADGPQGADWIALMKSEGWGYQPPVWPHCADVLAQCNGQPAGKKFVTTFRAGDPTPPEPDGSTSAAQRWTARHSGVLTDRRGEPPPINHSTT